MQSSNSDLAVATGLSLAFSTAFILIMLALLTGCAHEQPLVTPTAAAVPIEPAPTPKKPAPKAKAATVSKPAPAATSIPAPRPAPAVVSVPATEGAASPTPAAVPASEPEPERLVIPEHTPAEPEPPKAPALDDLSELCVDLGYPPGGDAFTQCRVRWGRARSLWVTAE